MKNDLLKYLCCPNCKSDLTANKKYLFCRVCNKKYQINNGIVNMLPGLNKEIKLSVEKWDERYKEQLQSETFYKDYENYLRTYYQDTFRQLNHVKRIKDIVYLEIGCGPFFLGQKIADKCKLIIGIDFAPSGLVIARKMLEEKGIKNYLLIQGDILRMPIKENLIDLIYGGGVIEHFKNTQKSVDEIYRVLRKNGVSFNTVPLLNLGALTYRQIWGHIPNFPLLKEITEFIHIKLLKGKHMIFGYEMSFMSSSLNKMHLKSGFRKVAVDKFEVNIYFEFIPALLRSPLIWLAKNSKLFWPVVKVIGTK